MRTRISPSQNGGIANATSVSSRVRWSGSRLRHRAEAIPSGSASTDADERAVAEQEEARADPLADDARDRPAQHDRLAEIAARCVADERHVLLRQRAVEPELVVDVLDDGFRRLAADHDPDRIAGDEMDQDEREQRHADDHGHAVKDPLDEIGGDGNLL